jgi:predicted nucleic acid-binding protein
VSTLPQPLGPPAGIVVLALNGSIQLCISGSIYTEYEEVVRRAKFQRLPATIAGMLGAIREQALRRARDFATKILVTKIAETALFQLVSHFPVTKP